MHVVTNNGEEIGGDTYRGTDWTDCLVEDITSNGSQENMNCRGWGSTHKYRMYVWRRE